MKNDGWSIVDQTSYEHNNDQTHSLLQALKSFSLQELEKVLGVSRNLAEINFKRYQNFENLGKQAAFYAYDGDVYKNISRDNLSPPQIDYLSQHLKIISGFYGLLSAFDKIKPYRLEMSSKLPQISSKSLNIFWRDFITENLQKELAKHREKVILNLASNEYSSVIDRKKLNSKIIDVFFLEHKMGTLKNIAINAKRARGMLLNYMIQNQLTIPEKAQEFKLSGYKFDPKLSDDNNYYFIRYN